MPLGVPKVAYAPSDERNAEWIDLYNRLLRDGMLFLCNELDDELSNQLIGSLLFLDELNKNMDTNPIKVEVDPTELQSVKDQREDESNSQKYQKDITNISSEFDEFMKTIKANATDWDPKTQSEYFEFSRKLYNPAAKMTVTTPGAQIVINSPGGSVTAGLALADTISFLDVCTSTVCVGLAASVASLVLASGTPYYRLATPFSRIMIHQPEGAARGQANEVLSESLEVLRIRRQITNLYAFRTGNRVKRIAQDIDRDFFMSARQAQSYGLIDRVLQRFEP
uniref:ATP-dependent Clp protease proteolytic subunit n=1 Tax=Chloroparvula japonica TaxID=1411623 RepID=A0A4D6C2W4_9CHLO|nr:proteolytic subunit 2 of clp protease [Chloroparvula japonica]QBX98106.1 proteolytic subunit 2 of clp protease [Chloroparvula japonica]